MSVGLSAAPPLLLGARRPGPVKRNGRSLCRWFATGARTDWRTPSRLGRSTGHHAGGGGSTRADGDTAHERKPAPSSPRPHLPSAPASPPKIRAAPGSSACLAGSITCVEVTQAGQVFANQPVTFGQAFPKKTMSRPGRVSERPRRTRTRACLADRSAGHLCRWLAAFCGDQHRNAAYDRRRTSYAVFTAIIRADLCAAAPQRYPDLANCHRSQALCAASAAIFRQP